MDRVGGVRAVADARAELQSVVVFEAGGNWSGSVFE